MREREEDLSVRELLSPGIQVRLDLSTAKFINRYLL